MWIKSLLFVDVDKFKAVNDTFGHIAGDTGLRTVAGAMKSRVRQTCCNCPFHWRCASQSRRYNSYCAAAGEWLTITRRKVTSLALGSHILPFNIGGVLLQSSQLLLIQVYKKNARFDGPGFGVGL